MKETYRKNITLLLFCLIIVGFFILYNIYFPKFTYIDEFTYAQDGIFIKTYIGNTFSEHHIINPLTFVTEYQQQTPGLAINVYPPLVSFLYSIIFTVFGNSVIYIKMLHLIFMMLFIILLYNILFHNYSMKVANTVTILLLVNFSFIKYFSILYREIIYVFFFVWTIYLFDKYLKSKKMKYILWTYLALIAGIFTKDIFVLVLPVLAFMILLKEQFDIKNSWKAVKTIIFRDWIIILLLAALTVGYHSMKFFASQKNILAGGFNPIANFMFYTKSLLMDNPVLFVVFILIVLYTLCEFIINRKIHKGIQYNYANILLFTLIMFLIFLIAIHGVELRYMYIFYPVATAVSVIFIMNVDVGNGKNGSISGAMNGSKKRINRNAEKNAKINTVLKYGLIVLLFVGIAVNSIMAIPGHSAEYNSLAHFDDMNVVPILKANNLTGNILLLSDIRYDVALYSRIENYNLGNNIIAGSQELQNARVISWSRFSPFLKNDPTCAQNFTIDCWNEFVVANNVKIILVDTQDISYDASTDQFAKYLKNTRKPVFSTDKLSMYAVYYYN